MGFKEKTEQQHETSVINKSDKQTAGILLKLFILYKNTNK